MGGRDGGGSDAEADGDGEWAPLTAGGRSATPRQEPGEEWEARERAVRVGRVSGRERPWCHRPPMRRPVSAAELSALDSERTLEAVDGTGVAAEPGEVLLEPAAGLRTCRCRGGARRLAGGRCGWSCSRWPRLLTAWSGRPPISDEAGRPDPCRDADPAWPAGCTRSSPTSICGCPPGHVDTAELAHGRGVGARRRRAGRAGRVRASGRSRGRAVPDHRLPRPGPCYGGADRQHRVATIPERTPPWSATTRVPARGRPA